MCYIDKQFLKDFLPRVETEAHAIYALMAGLPKKHFHVVRYYDTAENLQCQPDEEQNHYSLREFYERMDTFHPEDEFGIHFSVHLDRIDSDRAEEWVETQGISSPEDMTIPDLAEHFQYFLESYCERCVRDNRPFELTPETIAQYGFTLEDVATLSGPVARYNAAAKEQILAEYDALKDLDVVRKRTL